MTNRRQPGMGAGGKGVQVWADTVGHVMAKLAKASNEGTPVILTSMEARLLLECMHVLKDARDA